MFDLLAVGVTGRGAIPTAIVVMGVSGSGKSTLGSALATRLGYIFIEGDALHSAANVACDTPVAFIHPVSDELQLRARLAARTEHYMPASLLASQFATLEPAESDERLIEVDGQMPIDALVERCVESLSAFRA